MFGKTVWGVTFLLTPPARLPLIVFFRLLSKYWFQTMSIKFTLVNSTQIYWIKLFLHIERKCREKCREKGADFNKCASAQPPKILQSKTISSS